MKQLSRRELIAMSAGWSVLLAGCASRALPSNANLAPSAGARFGPDAGIVAQLNRFILANCASAPYATAAIYHNGKTSLHGYAQGVPSAKVDPSWIFGIGSNTKVFTATMLARQCVGMAPAKHLTDPVIDYLPASVGKNGTSIKAVTLVDLATHTASFPDSVAAEAKNTLFFDRPPDAAQIAWWTNWNNTGKPNAHNLCVGKTPGTCYSYSDWGFITLGFAVADSNAVAGRHYTEVLAADVTTPLGLSHTGAHLKLSVKGHAKNGSVETKLPTDLRSNAPDLLRFLQAQLGVLGGVPRELQRAIALTQMVHWKGADYGNPHINVGLAWQLPVSSGQPQLIWKNGEAGGFASFMGMIPSASLAVAILTNSDAANPTKAGIGFLRAIGG